MREGQEICWKEKLLNSGQEGGKTGEVHLARHEGGRTDARKNWMCAERVYVL